MGIQAAMALSLSISANFIFKLHAAALQAPRENINLYPIMDGFYAASQHKGRMLDFLRSVFEQAAEEFNREENEYHRFVIRGALAFGPVIHGANVPQQASRVIHRNENYRNSLLLGLPMVQANVNEKLAPPFGIYVHESARAFAPIGDTPIRNVWWKWRNTRNRNRNHEIWDNLSQALDVHYNWCVQRSRDLEYRMDRIEEHRAMAQQYFLAGRDQ